MTQARRALIIAPDDFPREYEDYVAACRALNLEPNEQHCYVVCRVSTAAGPRTLLTVDLGPLQDAEKPDTSDQVGLLSAGRSKEAATGTGAGSGRGMPRPPPSGGPPISPLREPSAASAPGQEPNPFGDFCRHEQPGGRIAGQRDHPVVQLVLDPDRATLKGVAVWNPRTEQVGIARETETVKTAARKALADTAAEAIVKELWPPHAASPALAGVDTAFNALKGALEPQTLLLKTANVAARVAAVHAGLGVVAPLVGQFAEELCKQYVPPPRESVKVLYSVDIDLYAAAGKLGYCPALRELTLEETSHWIEKPFTAWSGVDTPGRVSTPVDHTPDQQTLPVYVPPSPHGSSTRTEYGLAKRDEHGARHPRSYVKPQPPDPDIHSPTPHGPGEP